MQENMCQKCIHEGEIATLVSDSERNLEEHRDLYNKSNEFDKQLALSMERYGNILLIVGKLEKSVEGIVNSLEEIKTKPARRWDSVTSHIVTSVLTLVIAYFFNQMF